MSVEVQDLFVWLSGRPVLQGVNLTFSRGQIAAIVGPSGSGKTTLLRTINRTGELDKGFRREGRVLLMGEDVYQVAGAADVRRRIGMVFQNPVVLPLSIRENVLFGPRYFGEKKRDRLDEIVERCLKRANLWPEVKDKLHRPARQLSGGQQQRLAIARALAVEPEVLLLDEPCSSLDMASVQIIEDLLKNLAETITIVLVTHNLFQARRIAHDTALIIDGRVVESGPTAKMFAEPVHEATQVFLTGQVG